MSNGTANGASTLYLNNGRLSLTAGDAFGAGLRTDGAVTTLSSNQGYIDPADGLNKGATRLTMTDNILTYSSNGTGFTHSSGLLVSLTDPPANLTNNLTYITKGYADGRYALIGSGGGGGNSTAYAPALPEVSYLANVTYPAQSAYLVTGEFGNATSGSNKVEVYQGLVGTGTGLSEWRAGAYGTSTTTGNLTAQTYFRASRLNLGMYATCGTIGQGGAYPVACLTVSSSEILTYLNGRDEKTITYYGRAAKANLGLAEAGGLANVTVWRGDTLESSGGCITSYFATNGTHAYNGRKFSLGSSTTNLTMIQDDFSILTRAESDARYTQGNLSLYVPLTSTGTVAIVACNTFNITTRLSGQSTNATLAMGYSTVSLKNHRGQGLTVTTDSDTKLTASFSCLTLRTNDLTFMRNTDGKGIIFYPAAPIQHIGGADFDPGLFDGDRYITRAFADFAYADKASYVPRSSVVAGGVEVSSVDLLTLKGVDGTDPAVDGAVEITPAEVKFTFNGGGVALSVASTYFDFTDGAQGFQFISSVGLRSSGVPLVYDDMPNECYITKGIGDAQYKASGYTGPIQVKNSNDQTITLTFQDGILKTVS